MRINDLAPKTPNAVILVFEDGERQFALSDRIFKILIDNLLEASERLPGDVTPVPYKKRET